MHTTRKFLIVATVVATGLFGSAACGDADPEAGGGEPTPTATPTVPSGPTPTVSPQPTPHEPTPTATPQPPAGPAPRPVDWSDPGVVVDLGGGWTIGACEGGALLLCVSRDGATVGTIEALRFPLESLDVVDASSDDMANLRAIAGDFLAVIGADRAQGCGQDYDLEPLAVTDFVLGGHQGLRYGFVGRTGDGAPSELNIQYATVSGSDLLLITAIAYDEGGCPGRDDTSGFDSATLAELSDRLDAVLQVTPIPEVS